MTRRKKIWITVLSLLLLIAIGGAIYINYWLDSLVADLNSNLVTDNTSSTKDIGEYDSLATDNDQNNDPEKSADAENDIAVDSNSVEDTQEQSSTSENSQQSQNSTNNSKNPSDTKSKSEENNKNQLPPSNAEIANSVQQQIDKPIEKGDILQAGLIVIRKLSPDEINFMFGFSDNNYTKDELIEVRKVLLSKLNDKDIQTLRTLGQQYGKKLDILDPNVPIR